MQKKRSKKRRILIIVLVAVLLFTGIGLLRRNARRVVIELSRSTVKSVTAMAVNEAVYEVMGSVDYGDLIELKESSSGEIMVMQANSLKINMLSRLAALETQKKLDEGGGKVIRVPVGALTGSPVFAGSGYQVEIKIVPVAAVGCEFYSEFESVGINQTRHEIFMNVSVKVDIIMGNSTDTVKEETRVLVSETVIVGKVPDSYFDLGSLGGYIKESAIK